MTFRIECDNDAGYDEGFREWWTVTDDIRNFKCDAEADAIWLRNLLNGLRPLFDAQDTERDKPVSRMWADDLKISVGGGGGGSTSPAAIKLYGTSDFIKRNADLLSCDKEWSSKVIDRPTPPHHKKPDKPT